MPRFVSRRAPVSVAAVAALVAAGCTPFAGPADVGRGSCPDVPRAVAPSAKPVAKVEDPDGGDDRYTFGGMQPICGGVLVAWEKWRANDDERESPGEYQYAAYDVGGDVLWRFDEDDSSTIALAEEHVVLDFDEDEDRLRALDDRTGDERWDVDLEGKVSVRDYAARVPGFIAVDDAPGLGTGAGIIDLRTGAVTVLGGGPDGDDANVIGGTDEGFLVVAGEPAETAAQADKVLRLVDPAGHEVWSAPLSRPLSHRGYFGTLRVVVHGGMVALIDVDYDSGEDDRVDPTDRALVLDAATGRALFRVDRATGITAGPGDRIGVVRRPLGDVERAHGSSYPSGDGQLELYARDGTATTPPLLCPECLPFPDPFLTNHWGLLGGGAGRLAFDTGPGTVRDGTLAEVGDHLKLVPRATDQGFYTVDRDDALTLRSWTGAVERRITVPGVEAEAWPFDDSAMVRPDDVLVLDGAVAAYDGKGHVLRLVR